MCIQCEYLNKTLRFKLLNNFRVKNQKGSARKKKKAEMKKKINKVETTEVGICGCL